MSWVKNRACWKCCVPNCDNVYDYTKKLSFHRFPKDKELAQKWLLNLNLPRDQLEFFYRKRICGDHFQKRESLKKLKIPFMSKRYDVDSLSGNDPDTSKEDVSCNFEVGTITEESDTSGYIEEPETMNESFDSCLFQDDSNAFETDPCSRLEANYSEMSHIEALHAFNHKNTTKENLNPLCLEEDGLTLQKDIFNEFNQIFHPEIEGITEEVGPGSTCRDDEEVSNSVSVNEHNYYYSGDSDKLSALQLRVNELEKMNRSLSYVNIDLILQKNFLLNFYTGFDDIEKYNCFLVLCRNIRDLYAKNLRVKKQLMDYKKQIFMFLSRLRLGLLENDLAVRHNISQSCVSRIMDFWLNALYVYFKQLPIWPSKALIKKSMPSTFQRRYPSTRVIIDATELIIQKPADYNVQSSTYSKYKSNNTAKGLIGTTPNGFVSFISDLYPGRISDKELFNRSGMTSKLEPGDSVMADRGFTILNKLQEVNTDLNIPPFLGERLQLSEEDVEITRDIASLRIHVERVIRNIKIYRILKCAIPNSMAFQLDKLWFICSMLPNFSKVPLLERKK